MFNLLPAARTSDGWSSRPSGWNQIDTEEYQDDIFEGDLHQYPHENIMILAGGLDHLGRNHPWVKDRLDLVLKLYQIKPRKIFILGGGTYHKAPHYNREHFVIHESTMGAKYLIDRGVKSSDLYREWGSYDTIANGFFSLLNFGIPLNLNDFLVITSDFHMPRAREIFNWIYRLWGEKTGQEYQIDYLEVSSRYLDNDLIEARSNREQRSHQTLLKTIEQITTWEQFHNWFYQDHQAYNCNFGKVKEKIDIRTSQTY